VEQVYEAILSEITDGRLPPNARLIQDELAATYGVSRQPVQQALLLLRNHGLVRDAPRRGLVVSPLDVEFVRNLYEVRAVLEGLAARMAAEHGSERAKMEGQALIEGGRAAVESGSVTRQITADMAFHSFLYEISGNPLIGETTAPHWHYLRRVMGEVLRDDDEIPGSIWDEHAAILAAVIAGDEFRNRFGAVIANGQGSMKGQIFRIAHLGYFDFADLFAVVAGLEIILNANGHSVKFGSGVAAVQEIYQAAAVKPETVNA